MLAGFFLAEMKAQWDKGSGKILLGDNTGDETAMTPPIRFQCAVFGLQLGLLLYTYGVQLNTLRTGDADLRFYVTTVQDGWRRFAFLTRWNSVHLQVLLSATPQEGMFPQALLGSLVSISWKFQFTKIVSEFVINF